MKWSDKMNFDQLLLHTLDMMESQGLFANINKRKRKGVSRPKKDSTIDQDTYEDMKSWNEPPDEPVNND